MKKGRLIVFEGVDGSGKATQVELLRTYFEKKNILHIVFDFPRYAESFHAKFVEKHLSGEYGDPTKQNSYLASLSYAPDRLAAREDVVVFLYLPVEMSMKLAQERKRVFRNEQDLHETNTACQKRMERTCLN